MLIKGPRGTFIMDLLPPRTTTRLDIGPMIQTNSAKKKLSLEWLLTSLSYVVARMKMGKSENRSGEEANLVWVCP